MSIRNVSFAHLKEAALVVPARYVATDVEIGNAALPPHRPARHDGIKKLITGHVIRLLKSSKSYLRRTRNGKKAESEPYPYGARRHCG